MLRAAAQSKGKRKTLIAVFQRGAADGLNIVVPFFEPRYYQLSPSIAIPRPGVENGALNLDGRFGLHPALRSLQPLWEAGHLAIVHAAGSPDATRSHFDAQEYMECGTPGNKVDEGWLNRALPGNADQSGPMRAVAIGPDLPLTLHGDRGAIAIDDLSRFQIGNAETAAALEALYSSSQDARLGAQGKKMFDALRIIDEMKRQPYTPVAGAQYIGEFGRRLQLVARFIKADIGMEVAFADIGGWDHHNNERQQLSPLLNEFGSSLAAFVRDIGDRLDDVVLVTMSEFGRTVAENGTAGTDHGHGNVMMVLGGSVRGRRVYGEWPGLEPEQLFEKRDLAVTTDFRDVLGEIVRVHLGQSADQVFPGYRAGKTLHLLGV
jgi:uncharacterized protein (DUF1501 family)